MLIDCLTVHNRMYVDDLKIYRKIETYEDCISLQDDPTAVSDWCYHNKLNINITKCNVVTFTKKKRPIQFDYTINETTLIRFSEIRDLGIIFDQKFSFVPHINKNRFGAKSLEVGRDLLSLKFLYNLLHGYIDCPRLIGSIDFHVPKQCSNQFFSLGTPKTISLVQLPIDICAPYCI
ncbi:hypothetical protein WA026_012809 [Henosepilachna vigintioctopunctata]|uniref:Reverse transcriptase domain-containing protein n=1 Tax=Henosepilachna vigintioctopunctata TaxID=420089 RepID=A0AAW1TSU3_9CUCU